MENFSEQKKTKNSFSGMFAPVADYEETTAKNIVIQKDVENVDGIVQERPHDTTAEPKKRKGVCIPSPGEP